MNALTIKFGLTIATVVLAAVLAGSFVATIYREQNSRGTLLPTQGMTVLPSPKQITAFSLTDHEQHSFDLASLKGKWSFLFFGFTSCPDICPTTLSVLAGVRNKVADRTPALKPAAAAATPMQFVFISVDPKRDTPAKLGQYVTHFDSSFNGVTGSNSELGNLARQLGAVYELSATTPGSDDYRVFHTSAVFLVDPLARYHAVLSSPHDAETISKRFLVLRELEEGPVR